MQNMGILSESKNISKVSALIAEEYKQILLHHINVFYYHGRLFNAVPSLHAEGLLQGLLWMGGLLSGMQKLKVVYERKFRILCKLCIKTVCTLSALLNIVDISY